jgi:hypothetical protein
MVNCDFIMPYLKETGSLKGKNAVFTSVQQKYWELYQHPLTFFLLDLPFGGIQTFDKNGN